MAKPLGNHQQEANHASSSFNGAHSNNGNPIPETAGSGLKHNPGISSDWTLEEQAVLEDGLKKYLGISFTFHFQERVVDPSAKPTHFAALPNLSPYPTPMIPKDYNDGIPYRAIGGLTGELLEQNAQALNQISANLAAFQIHDNIGLLCQTRDDILKIMNALNDMPDIMKQMPQLPVKMNNELANTILPPPPRPMQL